jgi:hypothetical protein
MTASTASPSPGKQRQALARARRLLDHADGPDRAELADMITSLE